MKIGSDYCYTSRMVEMSAFKVDKRRKTILVRKHIDLNFEDAKIKSIK